MSNILPEDALQRLLNEVLSGLAEMHEAGYVHRDIKPGNLMLREEDGSVVVLDFGAARQAVGQRSKAITSILTPGYAPIEQYDSQADDVGPWSDIYALGMVAYRCISGISDSELPDAVTRGRTQRKGQVDLAPAVEAGQGKYNAKLLEAIDWAIEVDEEDRPQTVGEWQRALAGSGRRKGQAKSVRKTTSKSTSSTPTQRTGINWSSVALTFVILALVGVSVWMASQLYPEWFKLGSGDPLPVAQQEIPADMPGEIPQDTEPGEAGEALASAEETPLPEDTSQTTPAKTVAESGESMPEQPELEPAEAPSAEEVEVTRLLAAAETDLKARRLTSPAGNNAWDRYQQVLEIEPTNPEAVQGMDRVIESYMELFGIAVEQEDFDQADSYLGRIRDLHPDSQVLMTGRQQLEDAKQARAARLAEIEQQRQAKEAARLAELERQRIEQTIKEHWESFEAAMDAEDLDEATGLLTQMRDLNPEEPELTAGEQRLAAAQAELERQRQEAEQKMRQLAGEMVDIPGEIFRMGDLNGGGDEDERPVYSVTILDFKLGKHEVTFAQWDACVADGGCSRYTPDDAGWGRGNRPVINVSWNDIQGFIDWLNDKTGEHFRLPTEAEWEYTARAGSTTRYSWGNSIDSDRANCGDECGDRWSNTGPVGSFSVNPWGLYDMHGNVWEWVQDCYNDSYVGAPTDGRAWMGGDCGQRGVRGGSWNDDPKYLRSANRTRDSRSARDNMTGFRLAQDK